MYRQSFQSDLRLSAPANPDTSLLWRKYEPSSVTLPLYAEIGDKYYILCGEISEKALIFGAGNEFSALETSIRIMDEHSVTFLEWLHICKLCTALNSTIDMLTLPRAIRNSYMPLIINAVKWNKEFLARIAEKNLPWQTLNLVHLLAESQRGLLLEYIRRKNPSAQTLKRMIERFADFAQEIKTTVYDEAEFEQLFDRRTALHTELDSILDELRFARNPDDYESAALTWSFSTRSADEFKKILNKLKDKEALVERFYGLWSGSE